MEERRPYGEQPMGSNPDRRDLMQRSDDPARKADKGRRKAGAVVFTIITVVMMLLYIMLLLGIVLMGGEDPLADGMLVIVIAIPILVILGVVYACRERMKEIEGGEWDETSKY